MATSDGQTGFPSQKALIDLTPVSLRTREYWVAQGYRVEDVADDPQYQREILEANEEQIKKGHRPYDPEKFGPIDPAHPYAYTPRYVTFKMRREQGFRCFVMDWHEDDWVINRLTNEVRLVGKLTRDHTKAASRGGETSAENLKMVCELANRKKGMKLITYQDLRENLESYWQVLQTTGSVGKLTLDDLRRMGVRNITLYK
jgi:hypothetical protein